MSTSDGVGSSKGAKYSVAFVVWGGSLDCVNLGLLKLTIYLSTPFKSISSIFKALH